MNLQSLKMATKAILVLDNTQNHPEVEFEEAPLIVLLRSHGVPQETVVRNFIKNGR